MNHTMNDTIKLIVGLGNPGDTYANTRHNAGVWFVERLAATYNASLLFEKKFFGQVCQIIINNQPIYLLIPLTYMNECGQSVMMLANYYRIPSECIFIAHDELSFSPGIARIKKGGGHGGHNGLRNIINKMNNNKNFIRLRIGIGRPNHSKDVSNYVLNSPTKIETQSIDCAINESIKLMPELICGSWQKVIKSLHDICK